MTLSLKYSSESFEDKYIIAPNLSSIYIVAEGTQLLACALLSLCQED